MSSTDEYTTGERLDRRRGGRRRGDRVEGRLSAMSGDGLTIDLRSLDLGGDAVIVTDLDGTIIDVNDAFVRVTGYSRREAIGQTPRMLSSGFQDADFYATLWQTISSGQIWEGELIDRRRDGRLRTFHATISPVKDTAGRVTHYVAVERDVSSELERQAPPGSTGLLHIDLTGACVYANERAAALFAAEPNDLLGRGLAQRLEPDDVIQLREVVSLAAEAGRTHRLDVRTRRSGTWLHIEVAPLTVPSGMAIGAAASIEDLSETLAVHRELDRRDAFIASVLDALPDEVAVIADDGTVLAVNRAWRGARHREPGDAVLASRIGDDLEAQARAGAAAGDVWADELLDELHRQRTIGTDVGKDDPGRDHPRTEGYAVTPLAWDDGGYVLRRTSGMDRPIQGPGSGTSG